MSEVLKKLKTQAQKNLENAQAVNTESTSIVTEDTNAPAATTALDGDSKIQTVTGYLPEMGPLASFVFQDRIIQSIYEREAKDVIYYPNASTTTSFKTTADALPTVTSVNVKNIRTKLSYLAKSDKQTRTELQAWMNAHAHLPSFTEILMTDANPIRLMLANVYSEIANDWETALWSGAPLNTDDLAVRGIKYQHTTLNPVGSIVDGDATNQNKLTGATGTTTFANRNYNKIKYTNDAAGLGAFVQDTINRINYFQNFYGFGRGILMVPPQKGQIIAQTMRTVLANATNNTQAIIQVSGINDQYVLNKKGLIKITDSIYILEGGTSEDKTAYLHFESRGNTDMISIKEFCAAGKTAQGMRVVADTGGQDFVKTMMTGINYEEARYNRNGASAYQFELGLEWHGQIFLKSAPANCLYSQCDFLDYNPATLNGMKINAVDYNEIVM